MARRAPRRGQVTVAELLVRSAGGSPEDTLVLPRARHREKPPVLRSLARLRVFSVVAGALALTGGVAAAVSMPAAERTAGAASPPAGVEPPEAAVVPFAAEVVVPPAKPAPKSVTPAAETTDIPPDVVPPKANSENVAVRRGNLAKAIKVVGKEKKSLLPKVESLPKQAAPVRHAIPQPALWWGWWAAGANQQPPPPSGHHGCDGGHHRW